MAEPEGFEPSRPFSLRAFQARALDRYATVPYGISLPYLKNLSHL